METWMVMELMDRGTLAARVRSGALIHPMTRIVNMVRALLLVLGEKGGWDCRGRGAVRHSTAIHLSTEITADNTANQAEDTLCKHGGTAGAAWQHATKAP
jgi:hypothetical protein